MKKAVAIMVSVFVYVAVFLLCWELLLRGIASKWIVFLGFPVLVACYFGIAGEQFRRRFGIRRLALWLWINAAGYPLCWVLLTIRYPLIWFNLMIAFLFPAVTFPLAVVWGVTALVLKGYDRRSGNAHK